MSQYPPDTAEIETLSVWQRATPTQKKKKSFKWVSEECDAGMITATVKTVWSPKERVCHSVVTVTPRWGIARNIITFCARIWVKRKKKRPLFKKIQRSTSRQVERFMLSRPWAHLVGVYLEFSRELKLSVRMRGATVKQQMCVRSSLMRKTRENNSQCECGRHLHSGSIIRPELTAEEMRSLQIIHLVIGQKNKTLHTLFLQLLNSSTEVFNSWLDDCLCDSYR